MFQGLGVAGLVDSEWESFQDLAAAMLKSRSSSLSLDRGKRQTTEDNNTIADITFQIMQA